MRIPDQETIDRLLAVIPEFVLLELQNRAGSRLKPVTKRQVISQVATPRPTKFEECRLSRRARWVGPSLLDVQASETEVEKNTSHTVQN